MYYYCIFVQIIALQNHIQKICAFLLASLMLFTSVGFTVDIHFCQGDFKSFSLFGKAKNCHEVLQKQSTCKHHQALAQTYNNCEEDAPKDCCENKTINLDADQDQQLQTVDFELTKQTELFLTAFVFTFYQNDLINARNIDYSRYRPPLIIRDIPILIQSFLL